MPTFFTLQPIIVGNKLIYNHLDILLRIKIMVRVFTLISLIIATVVLIITPARAAVGTGNVDVRDYYQEAEWTRYSSQCDGCITWNNYTHGSIVTRDCGPINGAGFANNDSRGLATCNGSSISVKRSPVFPYIEPGAWYDKAGTCTIEWVNDFRKTSGNGYVHSIYATNGNILGMTRTTIGSQVRYSKVSKDCRTDLLSLGVTWGTGHIANYLRLHPRWIYTAASMCLYIDGRPLDSECPDRAPPPAIPESPPVYCDATVPSTVEFGTVSLKSVVAPIMDSIIVHCSSTNNVTMSFLGGEGATRDGMSFSLGGNGVGIICFSNGDSCVSNGFTRTVNVGPSIVTIPMKTQLTSLPNKPGDYSTSLIIVVQPN